jgi:undecaprenyl-diphosphatase
MIISSIILALLQAVAEFLPISSSGHLVIAHDILKLSPDVFNISFDIILHFGSLFALLIFFRKDIWQIAIGFLRKDKEHKELFINITIATIPAVIVGYFFGDFIENNLRSTWIVIFNLIFFGLVFIFAEKFSKMKKELKHLTKFKSFLIGFAQVVAFIPGVSRSGISIIAGLIFGLKREAAAKFAFLIAIPAISLASAKGIKDILDSGEAFSSLDIYITGFFVSFVASFVTIKYFLKYIKTHSFKPFMYYRFIIAFIMILYMTL